MEPPKPKTDMSTFKACCALTHYPQGDVALFVNALLIRSFEIYVSEFWTKIEQLNMPSLNGGHFVSASMYDTKYPVNDMCYVVDWLLIITLQLPHRIQL